MLNPFSRRDWRADVSAYLDGELSAAERAQVEARLAEDGELRAYLHDLERLHDSLSRFAPTPARPPAAPVQAMLASQDVGSRELRPVAQAVPRDFQLSPEMTAAAVPVAANSPSRTLRLSLSTAAMGVAAFCALLIFDAMDTPTVNFTTSQAGTLQAGQQSQPIPTATVRTERVIVQTTEPTQTAAAAQTAQFAEDAAEAEEAAPEPEAAAFSAAAVEEEAEAEAAAAEPAAAEASAEARPALTAGVSDEEAAEEEVTAADVVAADSEQANWAAAEEEAAEAEEAVEAQAAAPPPAAAAAEPTAAAAEPPAEPAPAAAETVTEERTIVTVTAAAEEDWPLPQRPVSDSVVLASDPSWELPVQIALAAIAGVSALIWLALTIAERRRFG